jgi:FkbM family methyltransferase
MKEIIYKLANIFLKNKGIQTRISGFDVRLPVRYYKFFIPSYELNNINFINNYLQKDMTAIDIGAHIGLLSVIISQKIGKNSKCYSFEPTPSTFGLLKQTIKINGKENVVTPFQMAVSDKVGKTKFYITDIEAHNSNSLSVSHRENANEHPVDIDVTTIDAFVKQNNLSQLDFLKIDAEGAEYAVLKGSKESIEKFRPLILLAIHPQFVKNFGDNLSSIWDFLSQYNYKVIYMSEEVTKDFFICQTEMFDVHLIARN